MKELQTPSFFTSHGKQSNYEGQDKYNTNDNSTVSTDFVSDESPGKRARSISLAVISDQSKKNGQKNYVNLEKLAVNNKGYYTSPTKYLDQDQDFLKFAASSDDLSTEQEHSHNVVSDKKARV